MNPKALVTRLAIKTCQPKSKALCSLYGLFKFVLVGVDVRLAGLSCMSCVHFVYCNFNNISPTKIIKVNARVVWGCAHILPLLQCLYSFVASGMITTSPGFLLSSSTETLSSKSEDHQLKKRSMYHPGDLT